MPLTKTASAHSKSESVAADKFSSTNRTSHSAGIVAAMRSNPCGGMKARTPPFNP
jgi:hypothetical protein